MNQPTDDDTAERRQPVGDPAGRASRSAAPWAVDERDIRSPSAERDRPAVCDGNPKAGGRSRRTSAKRSSEVHPDGVLPAGRGAGGAMPRRAIAAGASAAIWVLASCGTATVDQVASTTAPAPSSSTIEHGLGALVGNDAGAASPTTSTPTPARWTGRPVEVEAEVSRQSAVAGVATCLWGFQPTVGDKVTCVVTAAHPEDVGAMYEVTLGHAGTASIAPTWLPAERPPPGRAPPPDEDPDEPPVDDLPEEEPPDFYPGDAGERPLPAPDPPMPLPEPPDEEPADPYG